MALCPVCFGDHSPTIQCSAVNKPFMQPPSVQLDHSKPDRRQVRISALHAACVLHAPAAAIADADAEAVNEAVLQTASEFVAWIESDAAEAPPDGKLLRPGEVPHSPAHDDWDPREQIDRRKD